MDIVVRAKNIEGLKWKMVTNELTKSKLAKKANVSKDTVITIFNGGHVGPVSASKFCKALGIEKDDFSKYFSMEDNNKSTQQCACKS